MKKENRVDIWIDSLYKNKWLIIRYFLAALVCGLARYFFDGLFTVIFNQPANDSALLSWCIWVMFFYPCLKFFVFRCKSPHIYALLKQITIYILSCALLWVSRQFFVGVLYMLTSNSAASLAIGGTFNEIFCLWLMVRVVFKEK